MGGGTYCYKSRSGRATTDGYATKSTHEVFSSTRLDPDMNPAGIRFRESRDSAEHPNSVPIVIGLDVTGSMGYVPHELIKDGLPTMVSRLMKSGIADPQILFNGIGDHYTDRSPLQVGQFESSDELIDKWLLKCYLEGGGGGNGGESYLLSWYLAAKHTSIDSLEKRGQKGFLFTLGDDKNHRELDYGSLARLMGPGEYKDYTAAELLGLASEKYHVFHINIADNWQGRDSSTKNDWRELLGDNSLTVNNHQEIPLLIANTIANIVRGTQDTVDVSTDEEEPRKHLL